MSRKVTKVFNDTEAGIELKQGSANVFYPLHSLLKGKSYSIKVDESATYREYWCAVQPVQPNNTTAERVVFSSDDCTEFSKVRIYKDPSGKYTWEGTERRGTLWNTPVTPKAQNPVSTGEASTTPVATEVSNPVPPARVPNPVHDAKPSTWWTGLFRKKN